MTAHGLGRRRWERTDCRKRCNDDQEKNPNGRPCCYHSDQGDEGGSDDQEGANDDDDAHEDADNDRHGGDRTTTLPHYYPSVGEPQGFTQCPEGGPVGFVDGGFDRTKLTLDRG